MQKTINPADVNVAEQARRVELAKRDLINYDPFFRYLAARHEVRVSFGCPSPTACTDGDWVWFHPAFCTLLTGPQLKTVLAHELLHIYFSHPIRLRRFIGWTSGPVSAAIGKRWNRAGDYRINAILKDCGFHPVEGWLWDAKYADEKLGTEEVYRLLEAEEEEEHKGPEPQRGKRPDDSDDGDGEGEGEGDKGEGEGSGSGEGDEEGDGKGGGGGEGEQGEGKGGKGGKPKPQTYETSKLGEQMGDVVPTPLKNEQEATEKEAEHRTVLKQAASLARAQGTLPGSLSGLVEEITVPKVPWYDRLRNVLTTYVQGDDFTFRRPNKRYAWADLALPVSEQEGATVIGIVRDTSGSCLGDLPSFNAHIVDILAELRPHRVLLLDCDGEVQAAHDIEWTDGCDWPKEIEGGGGTSFVPPFDWLAERSIVPDVLIYLTDCYGTYPNPTEYPTVWVCTGEGYKQDAYQPPFGEVIPID